MNLGIDFGTTSINLVVLDGSNHSCTYKTSEMPDSYLSLPDIKQKEQDVDKIMKTVLDLIRGIPEQIKRKTVSLSCCGQMHGILFWSSKDLSVHSNLITWEDQRCDSSVLDEIYSHTGYRLFSGYGHATIHSIMKLDSRSLDKYDSYGPITSYFEQYITHSETISIDPSNAESLGFLDKQHLQWDQEALKWLSAPLLTPTIKETRTVFSEVSSLAGEDTDRPVKVYISTGDSLAYIIGSSFRMKIDYNQCVFINIGTSCQFSTIVSSDLYQRYSKSVQFPSEMRYFVDHQFIYCICGMNGGNVVDLVMQHYIQDMQSITHQTITKQAVYDYLKQNNSEDLFDHAPVISPVVYKERINEISSNSEQWMTIDKLLPTNMNIIALYNGICKGIVDHLLGYLDMSLFCSLKKQQIIMTGSVCVNNPFLQKYISTKLNMPYMIDSTNTLSYDGASGAALLNSSN